jgi:hypothetical protein
MTLDKIRGINQILEVRNWTITKIILSSFKKVSCLNKVVLIKYQNNFLSIQIYNKFPIQ